MNKRTIYFFIILILILLGLGSRKYPSFLPFFIAEHAGDALWSAMIYFGLKFISPQTKNSVVATLALGFSFAIEFSQLYQTHWIVKLRTTVIGALILGKGFLWIDLLRYTVGIIFAFLVDTLLLNKKKY